MGGERDGGSPLTPRPSAASEGFHAHLLSSLNAALRIVRLHAMENMIAREAANELCFRLRDRLRQVPQLALVAAENTLRVNEDVLAVGAGASPDDPAKDLHQVLTEAGIGAIVFRGEWDIRAVNALLKGFASVGLASPDERRARLQARLASELPSNVTLDILSPAESEAEARAVRKLRESRSRAASHISMSEKANFTYCRLIALGEHFARWAREERSCRRLGLLLRQTLMGAVDALADKHFRHRLLALTGLPAPPDMAWPYHAANVTAFSLGMGSLLELPRRRLLDLGIAAFHHDRGRDLSGRAASLTAPEEDAETSSSHVLLGVASALEDASGDTSDRARLVITQELHRVGSDGYPSSKGLPSAHPLSQLVALADEFDRRQSGTPWSPPQSPRLALQELAQSPSHRAELVELLQELLGEFPRGTILQLLSGQLVLVVDGVGRTEPLVRPVTPGTGHLGMQPVEPLPTPSQAKVLSPQGFTIDWAQALLAG